MKRNIYKLTKWEKYEKKLMANPRLKKKANEIEYEYQLAKSIIKLRLKRNLSQNELAQKVGTKQPVISRIETGASKPTLSHLERIARALDAKLEVSLS